MEEKVLEIMRTLFESETIDHSCSQRNCDKWDSMAQLNLVVELESEFGVSLEPEEIAEMTSFDAIIRLLKGKKG